MTVKSILVTAAVDIAQPCRPVDELNLDVETDIGQHFLIHLPGCYMESVVLRQKEFKLGIRAYAGFLQKRPGLVGVVAVELDVVVVGVIPCP